MFFRENVIVQIEPEKRPNHCRAGACSRRGVRIILDLAAGASPSPTK